MATTNRTTTTPTTRELGFIEKRRARLTSAGVLPTDMAHADTDCVGQGSTDCALCDTPIKYLFRITIRRPDGSRVEVAPVGSNCITSWALSMPLSPERERFLARVKSIEARLEKEKRTTRERTRREAAMSPEDRALLDRARAVREKLNPAGQDILGKAEHYGSFCSPAQVRYFSNLVAAAEAPPAPVAPKAPVVTSGPLCPLCNGPMALRSGRYGQFHGCRAYPNCRGTVDASRPAAQVAPKAAPAPVVVAPLDLSELPF